MGYPHPLAFDKPDDETLTQRFHSHLPQLIPRSFVISDLPPEILSWATRVLRMYESSLIRVKSNHTSPTTGRGGAGSRSTAPKAYLTETSIILPEAAKDLIARRFLAAYRTASFDNSGRMVGTRRRPMASDTLRRAAGAVGATSREHLRPSPFHIPDTKELRPSIKRYLRALENLDAPTERQKALTPKFLKQFYYHFVGGADRNTSPTLFTHMADLLLGAFFFAMRACEFARSPVSGRTRRVTLGDIVFRDGQPPYHTTDRRARLSGPSRVRHHHLH